MPNKLKVLIVEDNIVNLVLLKKVLFSEFDLRTTADGNSALKLVNENHYDVILMDIDLGKNELNGVEILHLIRKDAKNDDIKIFAVTSIAKPEEEQELLDAGFDLYIPKPVKSAELIAAIKACKP